MLRLYGLVVLLHAWVGWRLLPDLAAGTAWAAAGLAAWLVLSAGLLPMGLFARRYANAPHADRLAWAGLVAMGSFSSLFVLTFLREAGLLAAYALGWFQFRAWSAAAVPLIALLFTLAGLFNARRLARVKAVDISIPGLPPALHGFTIAQITDIHIGPTIKRPYVEAIVDAVNALGADMIAVTGDLVDGSVLQLSGHAEPLARLAARHGTYFVTGNHEYYSGAEAWIAELRRLGLRVLMNEHVVLEHEGESLVVAGVTDFNAHNYDEAHRSDPAAAMAGAPRHAAVRMLLAHQPRSAFAAEPAGFHLQLSGHTHGGQFWPWNYMVRLQQPFTAGLRRLGALWVYTSRGTGYWGPPKRLWAPSEITHLRLVAG
ncbi:MAG: metallophosphoesterase [Proteobacteria bacterium]|nr:metallophosphoesterase [Pseudomonadota bacterium]